MATGTAQPLSADQRNRILAAVYRELFLSAPATAGEWRTREGTAVLEAHLDALVDIVRRSTAGAIEPYLAQIHDDVCSKCPYQSVSGYCPQRTIGPCIVYRFAEPVVRAIGDTLREMGDGQYLARRAP
jgi:hypothetical protein